MAHGYINITDDEIPEQYVFRIMKHTIFFVVRSMLRVCILNERAVPILLLKKIWKEKV